MKKDLELVKEGMHFTGAELIENHEYEPFNGGVQFFQSYPHPLHGHKTERIIILKDDIPKVIEYLKGLVESDNEI